MSPTWHESITLHIGSPQRGLWWVLLAVSTDRKTKTDRRGLGKLAGLVQQEALICSLVRPFFLSYLFLNMPFFPIWPQRRFSPIQKQFPLSFLLPLWSSTRTRTSPLTPEAAPQTLKPSVHFLSAGQHCLLQEREHQEDPRPLPPFALGEVIRYYII